MNIVGITRVKNGREVEEFVVMCPTHDYYYNGRPPLVSGCPDCWESYFFCQVAQSKDMKQSVDQLDSAVRHAAELEEKGLWDFVPDHKVEIGKED